MRETSRLRSVEKSKVETREICWRYIAAAWVVVAAICVLGLSAAVVQPLLRPPRNSIMEGVIIPHFHSGAMYSHSDPADDEERASGQR